MLSYQISARDIFLPHRTTSGVVFSKLEFSVLQLGDCKRPWSDRFFSLKSQSKIMTEQDLALPDKFIYKQNQEENLALPFMVSKIHLEIKLMINAVSWKTD